MGSDSSVQSKTVSSGSKPPLLGLVMTGGGARGAYQAGVLARIAKAYPGKPVPFQVIAGASAGALNATCLASRALDFTQSADTLARLWGRLTSDKVFRTDLRAVGFGAGQLLKDLGFGGIFGGGAAQSLLDSSPLKEFIAENIPFEGIQEAVDQGALKSLAIVATDYASGKSFIFIQGQEGHPVWVRSRRIAVSTKLTPDHVWASAAIPIVFQPVRVETEFGATYFGDGCMRHTAPLSPAIRLGAEKILAIGVRNPKGTDVQREIELPQGEIRPPSLARVVGVILNAIFLDHLDTDVEHLKRMNAAAQGLGSQGKGGSSDLRSVDVLSLSPSQDLGLLAHEHAAKMPAIVRYLLKGLGNRGLESADLMSYLLFEQAYTQALFEIGYDDASRRISEIVDFLAQ